MADQHTRICIDFPSREAAADFVAWLRAQGQIPADTGAYRMNVLDRTRGAGGITFKDTFVLRQEPDAEWRARDRLTITREEQV